MEDEAILTDVETETVEEEVTEEAPLSAREEMLASIQKKRIAELEEDGVEFEAKEPEEDEDVLKVEEVEEEEPEEEVVEVKVDGEDQTVSAKEIREYQKNKAADKRLEEASTKAKALEARELALAKAEMMLAERDAEAKRQTKAKPVAIQKDVASKFSEAILTEDHDTVAELLSQVAQTRQQVPPVNVDSVVQTAVEKAVNASNYKTKVEKANAKFAKTHEDVVNTPIIQSMVNLRIKEMWDRNPEMEPWDLFNSAAVAVKDELGMKPKEEPVHKKTTIPKTPRRASSKSNINRDGPPPLTKQQKMARYIESRNARTA